MTGSDNGWGGARDAERRKLWLHCGSQDEGPEHRLVVPSKHVGQRLGDQSHTQSALGLRLQERKWTAGGSMLCPGDVHRCHMLISSGEGTSKHSTRLHVRVHVDMDQLREG